MRNLTIGLQLDKKRKLEKGFPVKLRVTHFRVPRYYNTGIYLEEKDFEKLKAINPRGILGDTKIKLNTIVERATEVAEELGDSFTFDSFKKKFNNAPKKTDVFSIFDEVINTKKQEGAISTANSYDAAKKSLKDFLGRKSNVMFHEITETWLKKYEQHMTSKGKSKTTVGFYLRNLKAVFNIAISKGIVNQELFPFGKRAYTIPNHQNSKTALSFEQISMIYNYAANSETWEELARDLWMFSFFANGANIKDICLLKWSNIKGDNIHFVRSKTKEATKGKQRDVIVFFQDKMKAIIERHGVKSISPDGYVFPFLTGIDTLEDQQRVIKQITQNINKWMKKIAKKLKIEERVTTYTARHSFATVMMRGGASAEFISKSLGHSSLKTTEVYLGSFEEDTRREYSELLTKGL